MEDLKTKVLSFAAAAVGVREQPLGSNRGPEVDVYVKNVGLDPEGHYPWCAAFVYSCFLELGAANPCPRTGAAWGMWLKTAEGLHLPRAKAMLSLIKPCMVFVMDFGHGTGHVGLVKAVEVGKIVTIEGNTNDGGSREGIGVFERRRTLASVNVGFIDFFPDKVA